jgi:AcrR family transcriptional regulator
MARVRISKEYDERLKELLDAAQKLFFKRGYLNVSVNDIIDAVGVAKGTFYHYFKSKEDLLNQLIDRFTRQTLLRVEGLLKEPGLNALDKMNRFFSAFKMAKIESKELMKMLMRVMYNDQNAMFRHKMFKRNTELAVPIFAAILRQGTEEGIFDPVDSDETAELIFSMGFHLNETVVELILEADTKPGNLDLIMRKMEVYERTIEKILGAPQGSLSIGDRSYVELFKPDSQEAADDKG